MSFGSNEEFMFFEMDGQEFKLAELIGNESISQLYEFSLKVISEDDIDFDDVIARACIITIQGTHHQESDGNFSDASLTDRFIHGVVSDFVQTDEGQRYFSYDVTVVPRIWPMQHRVNSRIFQELSVKDIISTLLDELGLASDEYRWDCSGVDQPIPYCVQYNESEFDFISRLMELEGIFYYFEHEEDKQVLVFSNDSYTCPALDTEDPLPFVLSETGMVSNQCISDFNIRKKLVPGKVFFKDYNFLKPTLKLDSEKEADENTDREIFVSAPFSEKARGDHLAQMRLESLNARKQVGIGKSNINLITPGYLIDIEDHPRDEFNKTYLTYSVSHIAEQPQVYEEHASTGGSRYSNEFHCIPSDVPFRAEMKTHKPRVLGTQTAFVSGPSGEEIYTDEHGRVKVLFHWDRYGSADEKSSCWVRVSQLWAGQGYGGFSLPRIGQEVIVDFIDGDPDNPIIIGRVHHADNRSPYKLPDKKHISTLKTNSTVGGDGFNEIRFDDEKGKEQLFFRAEKDHHTLTNNDQWNTVGNDQHTLVKNDAFHKYENEIHRIVDKDSFDSVTGDSHINTGGDIFRDTSGSEHTSIGSDRATSITGSESLKAGMDIAMDAGMNIGGNATANIDLKAGMNLNLQAGITINIKAGSSFISIGPAGVAISGPTVLINSGGAAAPANPAKPSNPQKSKDPEEPEEVIDAKSGKSESLSRSPMPVRPSTYGPQAKALKSAQSSGTPFCEECAAAAAAAKG